MARPKIPGRYDEYGKESIMLGWLPIVDNSDCGNDARVLGSNCGNRVRANGKYKTRNAIIPVAIPSTVPFFLLDGCNIFTLELMIPKMIPTIIPSIRTTEKAASPLRTGSLLIPPI